MSRRLLLGKELARVGRAIAAVSVRLVEGSHRETENRLRNTQAPFGFRLRPPQVNKAYRPDSLQTLRQGIPGAFGISNADLTNLYKSR